jgi:hypothetical protein
MENFDVAYLVHRQYLLRVVGNFIDELQSYLARAARLLDKFLPQYK